MYVIISYGPLKVEVRSRNESPLNVEVHKPYTRVSGESAAVFAEFNLVELKRRAAGKH